MSCGDREHREQHQVSTCLEALAAPSLGHQRWATLSSCYIQQSALRGASQASVNDMADSVDSKGRTVKSLCETWVKGRGCLCRDWRGVLHICAARVSSRTGIATGQHG